MKLAGHIIIFLGAPGAGKGTLSEMCVREIGFKQLSTGDLFRKHIQESTEIGKQIDFAIKSGKLVSDQLVMKMAKGWIENEVTGEGDRIILDGFPRTVIQAQSLVDFLKNKYSFLKLRIYKLVISDEEVINRIVNRVICENKDCQAAYSLLKDSSFQAKQKGICDKCGSSLIQRKDDTLESVKERLKIYHKHEKSLLDFFKNVGFVIEELNFNNKTMADVFEELKRSL